MNDSIACSTGEPLTTPSAVANTRQTQETSDCILIDVLRMSGLTPNSLMKKTSIFAAFILSAAFICISPATMSAKGRKKAPTPVAIDTNDKITAVHLASITIHVFATQLSKEYRVLPATKITANGRPGKLSDLATGMDVTVTVGANPGVADTIDAKSPARR